MGQVTIEEQVLRGPIARKSPRVALLCVAWVVTLCSFAAPAAAQMTYAECLANPFTTASQCASLLPSDFDVLGDDDAAKIFWLLVAAFVLVQALLAMSIWYRKGGDAGVGFAVGLLGPLGLFYTAFSNPGSRRCAHCKVHVPDGATVCFRCTTRFRRDDAGEGTMPDNAELEGFFGRDAASTLTSPEERGLRSAASPEERDCSFCAEPILANAKVCKHCGRDVEPVAGDSGSNVEMPTPAWMCLRGHYNDDDRETCVLCGRSRDAVT